MRIPDQISSRSPGSRCHWHPGSDLLTEPWSAGDAAAAPTPGSDLLTEPRTRWQSGLRQAPSFKTVSKDSLVTEGQTSRSEEGIPPLRTVGIRDPVDAISTTLRCVYPLSPPPPSPSLLTLKKRLHLCVTLGSTHVNFIIFCVLNVFIHFEKPLLLCIYAHISIFHCICFSLYFDSIHMYLN